MLQEKKELEINQFNEVELIVTEILKNKPYSIKYEECNNITFMKIIINNLENSEVFKLKNKISKELYHIEIYRKQGKALVEIHFKTLI